MEYELTPLGRKISRIIHRDHDKPERVKALRLVADRLDPKDLASIFGHVWTGSESLFDNEMELVALIHMIREAGTADYAMNPVEQARLRALKGKKTVTLYRGAAQHNIKGYSWTTKRETALFFAKRNALDGKPMLVTATFDAADLIFCFNGRNEFEVVVDLFSETAQRAMAEAKVRKLPEIAVTAAHALSYKVQAYGNKALFGEEGERARLQMAVVSARIANTPLERVTEQLKQQIADLEEHGFTAKAEELRGTVKQIEELWNSEEVSLMVDAFDKTTEE